MALPKSRKTSAVYMQQDRGLGSIYAARRLGDEGSIYAARQGMRECNNTNMRNPIIKDVGGLHMLVLFHCFFVVDSLCVCASPTHFAELEEEDGEIGFLQFHVCHCSGEFYHL